MAGSGKGTGFSRIPVMVRAARPLKGTCYAHIYPPQGKKITTLFRKSIITKE